MTGAGSRDKGSRGEREFLAEMGEELGVALKRNLLQTRESGCDCLEIRGFAVEVKRVERLAIPAWWRQAVRQAEAVGAEPLLAFRQNRKPWRVLLKTEDGHREVTLAEAAGHVREKWGRLYAIYPEELNGATYAFG